MRTLLLDFQNNHRRPGWPNIALLAGGLATAMSLGIYSVNVFSEISTLEGKQAAFERRSGGDAADPLLSVRDAQQLRNEVKQATEVLARLALPWDALFKDIESSQLNHVALLSIEPDSQKRIVKITAEAKTFDAMLDYIRSLQKTGSLTGVYLQSHHIEKQTAEKPVRFVLAASWVINP